MNICISFPEKHIEYKPQVYTLLVDGNYFLKKLAIYQEYIRVPITPHPHQCAIVQPKMLVNLVDVHRVISSFNKHNLLIFM